MLTSLGGIAAAFALAFAPGLAVDLRVDADAVAVHAELRLERDGVLSVTEHVTVADGGSAARRLPLKVSATSDSERVYTVRDLRADGGASAEVVDGELRVAAPTGESRVHYRVDGTVADEPAGQLVRWQLAGGWDSALEGFTASFVGPTPNMSIAGCFAGPAGSTQSCTLTEIEHGGVLRVDHDGLAAGDRIDLVVGLPAGTVPANAVFERRQAPATAFAVTTPVGLGFAALAVLLLGAAGYVVLVRRRDSAALAAEGGSVHVLVSDAGRVSFASPDGVLPGQVGTVIDERVDAVDIAATVIDLGVRNYLWISEAAGEDDAVDWQLSRRNPPDEQLHRFERVLYETLLPDGVESIALSELSASGRMDMRMDMRMDIEPVRSALYADTVEQGWFSGRSGRGAWLPWLGAALVAAGAAAVFALTFTIGHALLGVAVAIAGLVVLVLPRLLPVRTARGRALVGQVLALRRYLHTALAADVPAADAEMVFSRSLPYAVVLGETDRWLATFAELDPEANGASGIYWFGGFEGNRDLHRFGARFPLFVSALEGLLAQSTHLRALRTTVAHRG